VIALVLLYKWALLCGVLLAPTLALVGCHLAARDKAMQTLCVSQGASLGVLLAMGVLESFEAGPAALMAGPFAAAAVFAALTYVGGERLVAQRQASKTTFFTSVFASLLALGYLVSALFPHLEGHMSQIFFGDVSTLSDGEAVVGSALGLGGLFFLWAYWREVSSQSFSFAIFGELVFLRGRRPGPRVFSALALLLLVFSVQVMGFLFTVGCLFLPTALGKILANHGIRSHLVFAAVAASVSTLTGFLVSLRFSRLPTVPTIVVTLLALGTAAIVVRRRESPEARRALLRRPS